jgi:importin subunit beta-1
MLALVEKDAISSLLTKGRRSKTGKTKTLSTWATREIRKLKNQAQTANSSSW